MSRRFDPVAAAMKRRVDAGLCPICGGEFVERMVRFKSVGKFCVNSDDGRHGVRGHRIQAT